MANLSIKRKKEKFLKGVESVNKDAILSLLSSIPEGEDIYTYIVQENAFNTGFIDDNTLNEFVLKFYSDWYFLAKNMGIKNTSTVKVFGEYEFSPVSMINDKCLNMIKSGKYNDILPMFIQYVNKLEDKFFLCVNMNKLYCRGVEKDYPVRLYINIPSNKILDFSKEFLDRVYLQEISGIFKLLNNDNRFDTITIYTDYQSVEQVLDLLEEMKKDCPSIFVNVGKYSSLLGRVDDIIGFGEQMGSDTYLNIRCKALSSLKELAGVDVLKNMFVGDEKQNIGRRKDNTLFTPTEYLKSILIKNASQLAERAIEEIESTGEEDSDRLSTLYSIMDCEEGSFDINSAVNNLKRCITRNTKYSLKLDNCGEDDYDYLSKLFRLFASEKDKIISNPSEVKKMNIISKIIFPITETLIDVQTEKFLYDYFKTELAEVINNLIAERMYIEDNNNNAILNKLKTKSCEKLNRILLSVIYDGDEGREYIYNCLYDYIRILSTDVDEKVSVNVDGRWLTIEKDINNDIITLIPNTKETINNLSQNTEYIDNKLSKYGINFNNICLSSMTKDMHKEVCVDPNCRHDERFYYDPAGYLSLE
jgi:hypothetical protein